MNAMPRTALASIALVIAWTPADAGPGACGDAGAGDCCVANGTPFCDDADCCKAVCAVDPFCCDVQWDSTCALSAVDFPECTCGGEAPENDLCPDSIEILDGTTAFTNVGASTDDPKLPVECDKGFGVDFGSDIWYTYTPSCDGAVIVSTCGQVDYDSRLAAYTGTCDALVLVACNDDAAGCGLASEMLVPVTRGVPVLLRVGGWAGDQGGGSVTLTPDPPCNCPGEGDCCAANGTPGCDDGDCCAAVCADDPLCCAAAWDEDCAGRAVFLCAPCGPAPSGDAVALDYNWNGVVHAGEAGSPDSANGYRSISDRGLTSGGASSLGGASGTVEALLVYSLVPSAGSLDTVFIGGPRDVGNGVTGFDSLVDGDNVGIAPAWDPTGGTAELRSATSDIEPVTMTEAFAFGVLFDSSVGGGTFDLTFHFASRLDLTVTIGVPDWFADFDGTAPPPGAGVAFQQVLAGPLSGGDGFAGTESADTAVAGAPLNAAEALVTYGSLLELGQPILGDELIGVTFGNAVGAGSDFMTVGVYAASAVSGAGCAEDLDGDNSVEVDDLVAVILAWGPCGPPCPEDLDLDGTVEVDDLVAVILAWGPCP